MKVKCRYCGRVPKTDMSRHMWDDHNISYEELTSNPDAHLIFE